MTRIIIEYKLSWQFFIERVYTIEKHTYYMQFDFPFRAKEIAYNSEIITNRSTRESNYC